MLLHVHPDKTIHCPSMNCNSALARVIALSGATIFCKACQASASLALHSWKNRESGWHCASVKC